MNLTPITASLILALGSAPGVQPGMFAQRVKGRENYATIEGSNVSERIVAKQPAAKITGRPA